MEPNLQPPINPPPTPITIPPEIAALIGQGIKRLPTTWDKNIPRIAVLIGGAAIGIGAWWTTNVVNDPETAQMVGTEVNIPAICTAIGGVLSIVVALFKQADNNTKSENAVARVEAVSRSALVHVAAVGDLNTASAMVSPPVDDNGKMSYQHTLNCALVQASQAEQFEDAEKILALRKSMGVKDA